MATPGGKYAFPGPITPHMKRDYDRAVVYRWAIYRQGAPPVLLRAYIGETENLLRRIRQYRRGDPSQTQVRRIKEKLLDAALAEGLAVELHVLNFTPFLISDAMFDPLALSGGVKRKVIEGIAIAINDHVTCELYNKMPNPLSRRRDKAKERFGQWQQINDSDEPLTSMVSILSKLVDERITSRGCVVNAVLRDGDGTLLRLELRDDRGASRYLVVPLEDLQKSVADAILSTGIIRELNSELGMGDAGPRAHPEGAL